MPDLESLLERLIRQKVAFVIVGGFAGVTHGSALVTQDLDICCPFTTDNLKRLGCAVRGIAPVHRMAPSRPLLDLQTIATSGFKNLYLHTTLGQLDCMSEVSGLGSYEDVLEHSEPLQLDIGECRVLSLSALIRSKDALGRPQDVAMAKELRAILQRLAEQDPE